MRQVAAQSRPQIARKRESVADRPQILCDVIYGGGSAGRDTAIHREIQQPRTVEIKAMSMARTIFRFSLFQ